MRAGDRGVWHFHWRDREVVHPLGKVAVGVVAVVGAFIGILGAVFGVLVLVPLALVLHIPLRLLRRRGTVRIDNDTLTVTVDREAFRHA